MSKALLAVIVAAGVVGSAACVNPNHRAAPVEENEDDVDQTRQFADVEPHRSPTADEIESGQLPNTSFQTQDGRTVRFYADLVDGKVVVINFMFTECRGACPGTSAKLAQLQQLIGDRMGREVWFVSVSLDPVHDTPAVLADYARAYGAGPGWTFLTGREEDVEALRHRLGVYDPDPRIDADRTQHSGVLLLGNGKIGRWSAISALAEPSQMLAALDRVRLDPRDWQPDTAGR